MPTTPTGTAARTSAVKQPAAFTPVTGSVIAAPVPVRATDGKTHLAYELALTNMLGQEVTVNSVDVMGADRTLLSLAGDSLGYWMRVAGNPGAPTTKVGPGQSALIWIDVSIDSAAGSAVPGELTHTLSVSVANPSPPCCRRPCASRWRRHRYKTAKRSRSRHRWPARTGWTATAAAR